MGMEVAQSAAEFAAQTGRLDFVTSLLASISVMMVFGGLFAWMNVASKAEKVAKEAAEKKAEEIANSYIQQNLPGIIQSYDEFIRAGNPAIGSSIDADQIARAQEDRND